MRFFSSPFLLLFSLLLFSSLCNFSPYGFFISLASERLFLMLPFTHRHAVSPLLLSSFPLPEFPPPNPSSPALPALSSLAAGAPATGPTWPAEPLPTPCSSWQGMQPVPSSKRVWEPPHHLRSISAGAIPIPAARPQMDRRPDLPIPPPAAGTCPVIPQCWAGLHPLTMLCISKLLLERLSPRSNYLKNY